ncbi:pyridine nucleotide-disulfide oxidoreductase (plasmid) [Azospirillum argentinense]|uniref:Pyridine nucleotide-disulfide oxidoreductase n=1 Tax=Azospirillum argentinense TaxID=2970906 RepID=A0A060DY72_9PROT|nr:FAD-binding protein [Azospirillum argentinense]AIB16003.1 pyridine nucleotide-disulfide oxidoreductase [Azospirillum argentinense]EZQ03475.1 pyridine nucleotide-disulfide oxidoreductase [Azospirillum argentinense]
MANAPGAPATPSVSSLEFDAHLEADVLVLGGGPAGTWAAIAAATAGARTILADKGFCGTSGATAASGTTLWYVDPDPAKRAAAKAAREGLGGHLADHGWMDRVLDRTHAAVGQLADWGYPFPRDADGRDRRVSVQGPEYMRLMRRRVKQAGVTILDHCPALELLVDDGGAVAGAAGVRRQKGGRWAVRAKAVVIATGGCAFLSKALGCNVLTGDGLLMAAEAGADLSGMEFSNAYAIAPAFGSVTKTLLYQWASFTRADGAVIPGAASKGGRSVIARVLATEPVYARLDRAEPELRAAMRQAQPNFFLPFDRVGIDPFTQRFPVTLRLEGTVRGTGGLRLVDERCATAVPGLFAAGDAATREPICGGFTGGGSHNAAWAMSSGHWAGQGAADHARALGNGARTLRRAGGTGLREGRGAAIDAGALTRAVQAEVFPYDINYFRTEEGLTGALARLDRLWSDAAGAAPSSADDSLRVREAAAMLATARWMYRSALARTESRGMHRRLDHAALDPAQRHLLTVGGLDEVHVSARLAPLHPDPSGAKRELAA